MAHFLVDASLTASGGIITHISRWGDAVLDQLLTSNVVYYWPFCAFHKEIGKWQNSELV